MHVLLIKLIKLLPLTMCCFASVLASSFSYVFTLYLFVCVCSFVFSFYILFCLLNCFIFALVSRPCVLVCPPCLLCVGDICLLCVCVLSVCVHSVCMSLGLHVWLCICVLCERVCLVPLVQVVTSAFISLVWGSCGPLCSAPSQQRSRCHQTLQQTHTHSPMYTMSHAQYTYSLSYKHTGFRHAYTNCI